MQLQRWLAVGLIAIVIPGSTPQQPATLKAPPPEISLQAEKNWINSKPLKLADLRGQVVILNFWTFG